MGLLRCWKSKAVGCCADSFIRKKADGKQAGISTKATVTELEDAAQTTGAGLKVAILRQPDTTADSDRSLPMHREKGFWFFKSTERWICGATSSSSLQTAASLEETFSLWAIQHWRRLIQHKILQTLDKLVLVVVRETKNHKSITVRSYPTRRPIDGRYLGSTLVRLSRRTAGVVPSSSTARSAFPDGQALGGLEAPSSI